MINRRKNFFILLVAALVLISAAAVGAQEKAKEPAKESPFSQLSPIGYVTITLNKAGLGLGMGWDSGVLKFRGNKYNFQIRGIKVATVEVSKATAMGIVYNLIRFREFPGNYVPAGTGLEVFKGKEGKNDQDVQLPVFKEKESQAFKNDQGVYILLQATEPGANLRIGPEGFTIKLKEAL